MTAWRWHAQRLAAALGLPGLVAVVLALLAAVAWLAAVAPLQAQIRDADAQLALLARRVRSHAHAPSGPAQPLQDLAMFEQGLQDGRHLGAALARIHDAALHHGLRLEQGEFKLVSQGDDPVARYVMVLPVKAEYRDLRRFTSEVLRQLPSLALEEVSLQRPEPSAQVLDARLRFVLFLAKVQG